MKEESSATKRIISNAEKKDLMWNIIQPGDPYDIRKSMIAKLPGDRKFMGPHLELVCLLQAAEIERLCLFLEQHKVKLRESERLELDRHSYEVQIKQLSEKLSDYQAFKQDNQRLKDYIRRQTIELQQLQKQQSNMDLNRKYQGSLRQIQLLIQQNDGLKETNKKLGNQINNLKQIGMMNEQSKAKQFQTLSRELQRTNQNQLDQDQKYRQKYGKWEFQRKRSQSEFSSLNKKYQELFESYRESESNNQTLKKQFEKVSSKCEQYRKTFKQYEDRFIKVGEEIDRLNDVIREKSRLLNEQYMHSKQLGERLRSKEQDQSQRELTISELQQSMLTLQRQQRQSLITLGNMEKDKATIKSYEAGLQQFSIQVDRLNGILLKKQAEIEDIRNKNIQYQTKLKYLEFAERQANDYKLRCGDIMKKLTEFQRQNARLCQEIERLNYNMIKNLQERRTCENKNKGYQAQVEKLQNTIDDLSRQIQNRKTVMQNESQDNYLSEIDKLNGIIAHNKHSISEYEQKLDYYIREVKFLNQRLAQMDRNGNFIKIVDESNESIRLTQNKEEYINELKKKIKVLSQQLINAQSSSSQYASSQPSYVSRTQPRQIQAFKAPENEIQRLKDLLLNKEIQNSRLTQINEQLRELVHQYKRKISHSPYAEDKRQDITRTFSPETAQHNEQMTKMQTQTIKSKPWQIQEDQQIRPIRELSPQYRVASDKEDDNIERHKFKKLGRESQKRADSSQPSQLQRPSKPRTEAVELEQDSYKALQQRKEQIPQQSYRSRERQQEFTGSQGIQRDPQLQVLPDPSSFKKSLEEISLIGQPNLQINNLKAKYQQLLVSFQNIVKSHKRLNLQVLNLKQQKELNENYINLLTDKIQLLNNEISELKQHIDPKFYLQNQEDQLKRSYSLLLEKYNNAVFDNDALRIKLRGVRQAHPQQFPESVISSEIKRLQVENQQLKSNCATFSQYYERILNINNQLQRLNKILITKDSQLRDKQAKIRDFELQQFRYEQQIKQLQSRVRDPTASLKASLPFTLQTDSQKLSRQISRLQKRNGQLERIIRGYQLGEGNIPTSDKQEKRKLQSKLQSMNIQLTRLNSLLLNKKKDIEVLQEQNRSLIRNVDDSRKSTIITQDNKKSIMMYQQKIVLLSQEIQRLNGLLTIKTQNQKFTKEQFNEYQHQTKIKLQEKAMEIERLHENISSFQGGAQRIKSKDQSSPQKVQDLSEYERKIIDLSKQIDRLNRILALNQQNIVELEGKGKKYRSDIERLNNSLRLKVEESIMAQSREKTYLEEKKSWNKQILEKIAQYDALAERYQTVEQENTRFKQHLNQYEKRIKGLYEQFERLQKLITILKKENQDRDGYSITQLIQNNRFFSAEIQRLNEIIAKQRQELSDLRLNLADDSTLQKRINEDLGLFVVLFSEIESLRNRVKDQEKEVEEVRRTSIAARKI